MLMEIQFFPKKLQRLIQLAKAEKHFGMTNFLCECYVLVDSNGDEFYPFLVEEPEELAKRWKF